MILGKIIGKTTTTHFSFIAKDNVRKLDYVQVHHHDYGYVLCQVVELIRDEEQTIAKCITIGYKDKHGRIKQIRTPFKIGSEVLMGEDGFIKEIIELKDVKGGAYVGKLEGKNIDIKIDLQKLLTRHVAVLAKSGAGKSYSVGVLLEEIIRKRVPLLVIDPHGEYSTMKFPNDKDKDIKNLKRFGLEPKGLSKNIVEFGDIGINSNFRPLKLNSQLQPYELVHMLPSKLTNVQQGLLFNCLKNLPVLTFESLITELESLDTNQKWNIINLIEHLYRTGFFSLDPTPLFELIKGGQCSIINLKGVNPDVQQIITYKLLNDLFLERKRDKIPPFFAVIEEAHNFIPERSFGEAKSSSIVRDIASEGRKFGMGLCIVSQRPARVDKSVLSQVTTQIILKVTNPHDLKAISNSVEGISSESETEIKNLPIGNALITGIVDMPLFVNIRPRMTKHGGEAISMIRKVEEKDLIDELDKFNEKDLLPIISLTISVNDIKLMHDNPVDVKTNLTPCILFDVESEGVPFSLLISAIDGSVITDVENYTTKTLPDFRTLSKTEFEVLKKGFSMKSFTTGEILGGIASADAVNSLVKKGFFMQNMDGSFYINDRIILSDLKQYAFSRKIEFENITYENKLEPRLEEAEISKRLSDFVSIRDSKNCYVPRYELSENPQ